MIDTMNIQVLGLNHKSAPIEIRERISFSAKRLPCALISLQADECIEESLILSTCNRVEVYTVAKNASQGFSSVLKFLCNFHNIEEGSLKKYLYLLDGVEAIRHLFRVVSSLDSMVVGETQILGQVKDAYAIAKDAGATAKIFNKTFEEALRVGKKVRTETKIGKGAVSTSSAAIVLAKKIFGSLKDRKVMIIGAGKIAELAARHLYSKGIKTVLVANRTFAKAKELAAAFGGVAITFNQIFEYMQDADILISSTSAPHYIIKYEHIEAVMRRRNHRALFLIDLGLPRNISPEVAELEQVHLYNLDGLTSVCEASIKERLSDVHRVEKIIEKHLWQLERELLLGSQEALSGSAA